MADEYSEILAGTVSVGYLDCTLLEYARGIKYFVDQESRKHNCDTHLINLLRRAACVGWENIHMFKQPPNFSPSDFEQLLRLRDLLRQCLPYVLSAAEAAKMMDGFRPREHKEHRLAAAILDAIDDDGIRVALHEALAPTGEQS